MKKLFVIGTLFLVWSACSAVAQSPEELVRWIYSSLSLPPDGQPKGLHYLTAPERRSDYLSRKLVRLYDANDQNSDHGDNLATACFELGFEIPGNDYDEAEIARTLTLATQGDATRQKVTAGFTNFGEAAQIHYDFIVEDGFWRIDNIGDATWNLSEVQCEAGSAPAATSAPAVSSVGYCYKKDADDFRVYVDASGVADFRLESWQANGHSCFISGKAPSNGSGWTFQKQDNGRSCTLTIGITPDGGLRLSDPQHDCKMMHCGQRAVLDGLSYTPAQQVDCATLPPPPQY